MLTPQTPRNKPGKEPGVLEQQPGASPTEVKVFLYNAKEVNTYTFEDLIQRKITVKADEVLWVRVTGLADISMIKAIGDYFLFHPLALEDVVNTHQRCKVDDYPDYQFIVAKLVGLVKGKLNQQQVSIFLGKNFVVSFLEHECELNAYFDRNLLNPLSRLRSKDCSYLVYELLDYVTDSFFPVLADTSDKIDTLENKIMSKASAKVVHSVQFFKRDLRGLRQLLWASRDMISALMRNELGLISEPTLVYFRDCYDHAVRQMDLLESQRESAVALVDIYLSSVANRLGQVMRVLTVISVVFMPPTFLAGVWGMNFKNMPELSWSHGYLFAWIMFLLSGILPSYYFWKKGWLRDDQ